MERPDQTIIANAQDVARVKVKSQTDEPKKWQHFVSSNPQFAALFANSTPPQQAGEIIFSVRDDGNVDIFAFF
jgi:hypothetical protein